MGNKKPYIGWIKCSNCEYRGKIKIPYGMSISQSVKKLECPKCGCVGYLKR